MVEDGISPEAVSQHKEEFGNLLLGGDSGAAYEFIRFLIAPEQ